MLSWLLKKGHAERACRLRPQCITRQLGISRGRKASFLKWRTPGPVLPCPQLCAPCCLHLPDLSPLPAFQSSVVLLMCSLPPRLPLFLHPAASLFQSCAIKHMIRTVHSAGFTCACTSTQQLLPTFRAVLDSQLLAAPGRPSLPVFDAGGSAQQVGACMHSGSCREAC